MAEETVLFELHVGIIAGSDVVVRYLVLFMQCIIERVEHAFRIGEVLHPGPLEYSLGRKETVQ